MLGIIRIDYRQDARPRRNADACGHLAGLILLCYITIGRDRSPVSKLSFSISLCIKREGIGLTYHGMPHCYVLNAFMPLANERYGMFQALRKPLLVGIEVHPPSFKLRATGIVLKQVISHAASNQASSLTRDCQLSSIIRFVTSPTISNYLQI